MISDAEFSNMTDSRKIMRACRIAQVSYPDLIQSQRWMLELVETAHETRFQISDGYAYEGRGMDDLHELAESEVPYNTYRLWLIWADLQLYDKWPDMEYGAELIDKNSLTQMPQFACYEIALRVLTGWGEGAY